MVGDSTVERMAVELLAVVRKKERVFLWVRRWERGCEGSSFACLGGNAPEWAFLVSGGGGEKGDGRR